MVMPSCLVRRWLVVWIFLSSALRLFGFDPAAQGNLVLHLKADALNQPDQTLVTEWGPLSALGSATPTFIASDSRFNGQPVVRFDGDDVLKKASANYAARTIFVVACMESSAANLAGLISNGSDGLNVRRNGTSSFYRSPAQGMDANDFVGNGPLTGTLHVNQVASGSITTGQAHLMMAVAGDQKTYNNFWIGSASSSLGRYWTGSVSEVLVYDGVLTQAQTDAVGWYLQSKYALPTNFPSQSPEIGFSATAGGIVSNSGILSTAGAPVTLAWSVQDATSLSVNQGVQGSTAVLTGGATVTPAVTTTYTLTATNPSGSAQKSITVHIGTPKQEPIISEFLASNSGGLRDEDGDSPDWIEIHNPNPFAIDMGGYRLHDSANQWPFPAGALVEAGGYRVVFASSKYRVVPTSPLHTNFALGASGDSLSLLNSSQVVVSAFTPTYPEQRTNGSYGTSGGNAAFFDTPTPGAANGTPLAGWVRDVQFSVARGFYNSSFQLALTTPTAGAVIRYTTDASTPTETNGTVYTGTITVNATRTIRARAFLTNHLSSPTETHSYLFLSDVLANQVYATGTAPSGWPTSSVNGQVFRYGWNTTLKAQYTNLQLTNGLKQIPTISVVTDQPNLTHPDTGIYVNGTLKGDTWERPASVEYLTEDGSSTFHIDCGLRIRGGASRNDGNPKHSLRLHFRGEYGASSMVFPIHGADGTEKFDTIDLRTEQNYHWANSSTGTENTAVREVFCRDLMGAMGEPATRSTYVHLYLNGQYWGIYQTEERAQQEFGATYFGGEPEDYDVVQTSNHPNFTYELSSGQINAWQTMWNLARAHQASPTNANYFVLAGRDANGVRNPALPVYLDPDHLITYMLLHYYTGDGDGPLSNFLSMNRANNWRGMRNRLGTDGFRFFVHDAEHSIQATSWVDNRANTNAPNGSNRSNFTYSNPEGIHEDLTGNTEYRMRFADIAQKHLFNGGAMTPTAAQALFDARAAQIAQAIVPDVSRWGQSSTNHTLSQWNGRLNAIRTTFFPSRPATLLGHLRTRGLFPSVNAPTFSQRGGSVGTGFSLTLNAGSQVGTIYYTLDGSDPRAIGGAIAGTAYTAAIPINGVVKVRARFRSTAGVWSALDEVQFIAYPPATNADVVVTKVHYHPSNPTNTEEAAGFDSDADFEYLELMNISAGSVDLTGVKLTTGVTFDFANADIRMLPPGGRVLIAGNAAALQFRHGPGLPIAGTFTGDLDNGGEQVRFAKSNGTTLLQFTYDDEAPWPVSPDGDGFVLVLKNPTLNPNHSQGANWRASTALGGRPGEADQLDPATWRTQYFSAADIGDPGKEATVWGDDADPDGDGLANLIEMATGTIPNNGTSRELPTASWWTDPETSVRYLTLTCRLREEMAGLTVVAEASGNLVSWPDQLVQSGAPVSLGGGLMQVTFRDTQPLGGAEDGHRFLRLRVLAD
jgi:hypothetical protein